MSPVRLLPLCLLAASCSHQPPAPTADQAKAQPSTGSELSIAPNRALAPGSTFADLVRMASLLDATDSPSQSCLLARGADGAFALAGEIRAGLRPLPQPALELDEPLQAVNNVQVLTPWGTYGSTPSPLAFASFSDFPPLRDAIVLVITERGISLRSTAASGTLGAELAPQAKSISALGSLDGVVAFVAAEAAVPMTQVYTLLEELGRLGARTAFAVNLAPGTALPSANVAPTSVQRCPDGLSATEQPEGNLELNALLAAVSPLKDRAPDCLTRGGAQGAAGGKLTLALRIDAQGKVSESCVQADELGDPAIAACVLELTRGLVFPAPQPAGVVDAELPLVLRPHSAPAQAPVCPTTEN
ncbi:MAG: hypothetical protein QM778_01060 [Myxococcales bacterium]